MQTDGDLVRRLELVSAVGQVKVGPVIALRRDPEGNILTLDGQRRLRRNAKAVKHRSLGRADCGSCLTEDTGGGVGCRGGDGEFVFRIGDQILQDHGVAGDGTVFRVGHIRRVVAADGVIGDIPAVNRRTGGGLPLQGDGAVGVGRHGQVIENNGIGGEEQGFRFIHAPGADGNSIIAGKIRQVLQGDTCLLRGILLLIALGSAGDVPFVGQILSRLPGQRQVGAVDLGDLKIVGFHDGQDLVADLGSAGKIDIPGGAQGKDVGLVLLQARDQEAVAVKVKVLGNVAAFLAVLQLPVTGGGTLMEEGQEHFTVVVAAGSGELGDHGGLRCGTGQRRNAVRGQSMEARGLDRDGVGGVLTQFGEGVAIALDADRVCFAVGVGAGDGKTVGFVVGDQLNDHFLRVAGEHVDGRSLHKIPGDQEIDNCGDGQQQGDNEEDLAGLMGGGHFLSIFFRGLLGTVNVFLRRCGFWCLDAHGQLRRICFLTGGEGLLAHYLVYRGQKLIQVDLVRVLLVIVKVDLSGERFRSLFRFLSRRFSVFLCGIRSLDIHKRHRNDGRRDLNRFIHIRFRSRAGKVRGEALAEILVQSVGVGHAHGRILGGFLRCFRGQRLGGSDDGRHNQGVGDLVALHIQGDGLLELLGRLVAVLLLEGAGLQNDARQLVVGVDGRGQGLTGHAQLIRHGLPGVLVLKGTVVAVVDAVEHHAQRVQVNGGVGRGGDVGQLRRGVDTDVILGKTGVFHVLQGHQTQITQQETARGHQVDVFGLDVPEEITGLTAGGNGITQIQGEVDGPEIGDGAHGKVVAQRDIEGIEYVDVVAHT